MEIMLSTFILQLLILLCSLTNPLPQAASKVDYAKCSTSGNYTSASSFLLNLDLVLSSLQANTVNNGGFFNNTIGQGPDQVYGLAMCYYDTYSTSIQDCTNCLTEVARNITTKCPYSTKATLWHDQCFIRYSNQSFFSIYSSFTHLLRSKSNVSDPNTFTQVVVDLVNKLSTDVASSPKLVAVGEANYTTPQTVRTVYVLVECTRDLSPLQCKQCIQQERERILTWCPSSIYCKMFGQNCYMRYEQYQFYSSTSPAPSPAPVAQPSPPIPSPPTDPIGKKGSKSNSVVIIVVPVVVAVVVVLAIVGLFLWSRNSKTDGNTDTRPNPCIQQTGHSDDPNLQPSTELTIFNLNTLRDATNNFSNENKLGEGGFGKVYKGMLQDRRELAVKWLATISMLGITQLKNEVELLGRIKHRNLIKVLGYCLQEEEKLLCYEYMPNGSLDRILFASDIWKRKELNWMTRFNIIEGICRGLVYLHVESGETIVHRDLKASNILLDKNMNPKISDFGIARLFSGDNTHIKTFEVIGTSGYIAPEYQMHFTFSQKSDVFSFGVLILEIVTGRRINTNLISYVWQHWIKRKIRALIDPSLPEILSDQPAKCIHIGLLCVQEKPEHRPSISDINHMLLSPLSSLPPVPPGNFIWKAQMTSNFEDSICSSSPEYTMDEFYHHQSIHSR